MDELLKQVLPVERAGFSERVKNILLRLGCPTLGHVAEKDEAFFLAHQYVGVKTVGEINRVLVRHGLGTLPVGDKKRYPPVPRYPVDVGRRRFLSLPYEEA